jgi:hypothetical protein
VFWLVIFGVAVVYAVICTLAGFAPVVGGLDAFRPEEQPIRRRFHAAPQQVYDAYRAAIPRTPGMRCVDERGPQLLIDLRPTSRVLGGDYGQAIRLSIEQDGVETVVVADARHKVRFGVGNHSAAFAHAERALRMRAKQHGLRESLAGVSPSVVTSAATPPAPAPVHQVATVAVTSAVAPGWYPDPVSPVHLRFWDGSGWTDRRAPRPIANDRS